MCDVSDDPSLRRARAAPANRLETRVHHLSPHSFRVTTITDVLEQGVPLEDVQRLAGPADPRTTRLGTEVTSNWWCGDLLPTRFIALSAAPVLWRFSHRMGRCPTLHFQTLVMGVAEAELPKCGKRYMSSMVRRTL